MAKNKHKPSAHVTSKFRTPLKIVSVILLFIVISGAVFLLNHHTQKGTSELSSSPSSKGNSRIDNTPAPAADNNTTEGAKTSGTVSSSPTTGTNTSPSDVQIVSATVNNGNLHVGTEVFGITSGSCSLTASQSGQSSLSLGTSTVKQDVNYYDCGVFNVPTSSFPNSGTWQLTLTVSANGAETSNSTNVTI